MINGPVTFETHAAVGRKRLVKMNGTKVEHSTATATDNSIGITAYDALISTNVAVNTLAKEGTHKVTAAGAFSAGVDLYQAADGKVQALPAANGTYRKVGVSVEAAIADGDEIDMIPCLGYVTTVVNN